MSAKNQHVQDNSIAERRLRPIYDWLDSGNNKKALQECEKVLKKTPNLHCAKALKALTLLRIGKDLDYLTVLDNLSEEKPTDEATLQAITLCCRESHQLERVCKFYEAAIKEEPLNEELYTHLFMSYVRIQDFKAQQQTAMALYKFKSKNPYYCWAVMSIILQATRGEGKTDAKKRVLLLILAERMMTKLIVDNKMDAEQQVQLYIMILELQDKDEEILKVLDGPLKNKLACSAIPQVKMKYLIKLQKWSDINLICKKILVESVDRWDIWKHYVHSVIELIDINSCTNNHDNHQNEDNEIDSVDDTPEKCHEFICRLVENGADNGFLLRGPYLARFELCKKLSQRNIDTLDLLGETIELFIEYFRKFGHKLCCVSDLKLYLNLLDGEKKSELSSKLIKDVGISATNIPSTESQMQRHICALQLSRLCGSHRNLSTEHLKALVTAFSLHYQHGYQSYGTNLLSTDLGPSDPYALLAAHVLYDLAQLERSPEPIIVALVLLESLLKNSPSNFHAKLLGVRLYHTVGGGLGAQNMYNSLDVKHLQLDSLGFIHCARLPTTGLLIQASILLDVTHRFFTTNYKDSTDHLASSYKFGSFIKLDEFMDFRERVNNSVHHATVIADRIILHMVQCPNSEALYVADISPKILKSQLEFLRDNNDLSVYTGWDPERVERPENCEETRTLLKQNVDFLKLRVRILWAMALAIDIVKSSDGVRCKAEEGLRDVLAGWESRLDEIKKEEYTPISQSQVTLPLPSRIHCALECPYFEIIHNYFNLLLCFSSEDIESAITFETQLKTDLTNLVDNVEQKIKNTSDFLQFRQTMEYVVNNIEIICVSSLICTLCVDLMKSKQGKKGKRKIQESKGKDILQRLIEETKISINKLEEILQLWVPISSENDITSKLESLSLNTNGSNVFQNISESHTIAVQDLQAALKTKSKLLNSLNC